MDKKSYLHDFLIQSFFGISFKDIDKCKAWDELLPYCSKRAYRDMARVIDYKKADSTEKVKEEFKNDVTNTLKEKIYQKAKIEELIKVPLNSSKNYPSLFEDKGFRFGMSQKWVNMTLKYLWLLCDFPISEKKLHVPIDHYILLAALGKKEGNANPYALGINTTSDITTDMAWSKIEYPQYIKLQKEIRDSIKSSNLNICPIEWEFNAWLEQARIESVKQYHLEND